MPGQGQAGPLGTTPLPQIDKGTLNRGKTPSPAPVGVKTTAGAAPATPAVTDAAIEALNLRGAAKRGAYALKKAHPAVKFTSGRRNKEDQARAMASNVVKNRKWIEQTYVSTAASRACQAWVDKHPEKKTKEEIAAGLLTVPNLEKLSRHITGDAFDVQPVTTNAAAIKRTIRKLKGLDKFLEKEGGLVRWHAQF